MIFIASDHRGFNLKQNIYKKLIEDGFEVINLGNHHLDPNDDYPDFAKSVAEAVATKPENRGILLCGTGIGVDIIANKIDGIRSALVSNVTSVKLAREHEDVNVISLPAESLDDGLAWEIIRTFLETPFSDKERHKRRLQKLQELEENN